MRELRSIVCVVACVVALTPACADEAPPAGGAADEPPAGGAIGDERSADEAYVVGDEGARLAAEGASRSGGEPAPEATAVAVVTDIQLRASNSSCPPGPSGYTPVGCWDVDRGGALGTNGSSGSYMMAMYAKYESPSVATSCVESVYLLSSNQGSLPSTLSPSFISRGYWDVDKGGALGGNGVAGFYMMGLYTASGSVANGSCIQSVELTASNGSSPLCVPGYDCAGWWDVDKGGGFGTYGSTGSWMMTLSTLSQ
jgi:hypothetical protein